MIAAPDDQVEEAERHGWLATCSEIERAQMLAYLIGWDPATFDQARAFVERIRAGASA